jgi:hypothetical protein
MKNKRMKLLTLETLEWMEEQTLYKSLKQKMDMNSFTQVRIRASNGTRWHGPRDKKR